MKQTIKAWINFIKNYKVLKELQKTNPEEVACENLTFLNVLYAWQNSQGFQNLDMINKTLKNLPKEEQKWLLRNVFEKKDISDIEEEQFEVLIEKSLLCNNDHVLVEENLEQLQEIEAMLSFESFIKVLHSIRTGKIPREELSELTDHETLSFINRHPDFDIATFLTMNRENRLFYMREYQDSLKAIVDYGYTNIFDMKKDLFQKIIGIIKKRFPDNFCSCVYVSSYDMLEELACEYKGDEDRIIEFVFYAFPNQETILEDGKIPDSFKKLVEKITRNKTQEELDVLKEKYYQFLNVDSVSIRELRYQTILREEFIESENKEQILKLLDCSDRIEYQNRERMMLESGLYQTQVKDANEQSFIEESRTKEMLEERIHLILSLKHLDDKYRDFVIERMRNIERVEDARKINSMIDRTIEERKEENNYQQLLENLPGKKQEFVTDQYSISLYNMDIFLENASSEPIEITKGPLRLVICPNNTCKK